MNSTIQQFVSAGANENATLNEAHVITGKLAAMGHQANIYAGSNDSGPGGAPVPDYSQNEAWLVANGIDPANDAIYLRYYITGQESKGGFTVGQDINGYFSGREGPTNSYDKWTANLQLPNDYSKIPGVSPIVASFMSMAVPAQPSSPAAPPPFKLAGPVVPDINNSLKAPVSINGQAAVYINVIQSNPPAAYEGAANVTDKLTAQGVDVPALLAAMQAALGS